MSWSMNSYRSFAWRDALSMAAWLEEEFDLVAVRKRYEAMADEEKSSFEVHNAKLIEELIAKTEGQRPAYLRKVGKNVDAISQGILIIYAIIGQIRVMETIELRDRFIDALSPGLANRSTCAGIYAFHQAILTGVTLDEWPGEVFEAIGSEGGWPDDDDTDVD